MSQLPASVRTRFVAHTDRVDDPGDLLDHLGSDGFAWLEGDAGFVTNGVAARVPVHEARALLDAVEHVTGAGAPDVAPRIVAALPFEGGGEVLLPAELVGRTTDGRAWRTTVDGSRVGSGLGTATAPPREFTVRPAPECADWHDTVRAALDAIAAGDVEKVVLSREVQVKADQPFDIAATLADLRATQPGCVVYGLGGFVGASPELLVRRDGSDVVSRPMAGTGTDAATLQASAKDSHEHAVVTRAIVGALERVCDGVTATGPTPVAFSNVTHLSPTIRARLRDPDTTALDLVHLLHPTPAVGGWPTPRACALLAHLEGRRRGRYAGACGWTDGRGDGAYVVALRGAEIDGRHARLFAGAGIVAGSDPAAEFAETQAKLQPMLRVLVRP
jgi:menaquinone-specific isochorismate synthase